MTKLNSMKIWKQKIDPKTKVHSQDFWNQDKPYNVSLPMMRIKNNK